MKAKEKKNISQGQNFIYICPIPILPLPGDPLLQKCSSQLLPKSCSPGHTRLSSNLEGKARQLVSTGKKTISLLRPPVLSNNLQSLSWAVRTGKKATVDS